MCHREVDQAARASRRPGLPGEDGVDGARGPAGLPGVAGFYVRTLVSNASGAAGGQVNSRPTCDVATGGGFRLANTGQTILYSQPLTGSTRAWEIQGLTAAAGETMTGYVVCADLG